VVGGWLVENRPTTRVKARGVSFEHAGLSRAKGLRMAHNRRSFRLIRAPLAMITLTSSALATVAIAEGFGYAAERDAYRRFARDVRGATACVLGASSQQFVEGARGPDSAHPCQLHALSLLETVRDESIRHERDRVLHLASTVQVSLDAAPPNNRRALDALVELERLSRR
jgi:hypothetical protein